MFETYITEQMVRVHECYIMVVVDNYSCINLLENCIEMRCYLFVLLCNVIEMVRAAIRNGGKTRLKLYLGTPKLYCGTNYIRSGTFAITTLLLMFLHSKVSYNTAAH